VQRAQLVVTGLMHVSILLLPRLTDAARQDTAGKAKRQPGNSTKPSGGSKLGAASSSTGKVASNNLPAPGFPADGSNLATWSGVNEALAKQAASGLDWGNSCVYTLSRDKGPRVAPQPGYPLTATAAFHAAVAPGGKKEAIICNDYDQK